MTHAPALTRPPGPQLGPLELARLLRRRQMTELLERAARQSPEVAHFRLGVEHAYLVSTPELVRELFGSLGRVTAKGRGLEQARLLLGDGLLTSEGDLHRRQRRLIQPAFHHARIPAYEEVMRVEAAALPERAGWAEGAVRDLAADMADLTLRIVGRALFATDLAADSPAVAGALAELLSRFQRVMLPGGPLLNRVPLPSTLRVRAAIADLDGVVRRLIAEHRAAGRTDGLLADLLAARDEDGRPMPADQVRDEVLTLVLAGHETTANALAWSWVQLDRHPEAAARLHAEVDAAPAVPALADLPWTRAVVAETMRLYPPAWVIGRRMLADAELGGWTVPARSIVMASQWVTHRDPRWWPDPAGVPAGAVDHRRRLRRERAGAAAGSLLPVRDGAPGLRGRVLRLDRGGAGAGRAGPGVGAGPGARRPGGGAAARSPSAPGTACR